MKELKFWIAQQEILLVSRSPDFEFNQGFLWCLVSVMWQIIDNKIDITNIVMPEHISPSYERGFYAGLLAVKRFIDDTETSSSESPQSFQQKS